MKKKKDIGFIVHRGSGKSLNEYFVGLEKLYHSGDVSHKDYAIMKAAALTVLCGVPEKEAIAWMERELSTENRKELDI